MKKKFHWRLWLLRWHRRIGVLLSVFLLWMLVSGVLLNHADDFQWDKKAISSQFWLYWYGVDQPTHQIVIANKVVTITDSGLYLFEQNLGDCSLLLGVIYLSDQVVIACPQHLLLLTKEGEVIDQIDNQLGLQQTFTAAASENNTVFLQDLDTVYRLNTEDLSLSVIVNHPDTWLKPISPSARISMERWLLDAHSGRLFGHWGVWLIDALALFLVILVLSGWVLAKKRHQRML
jgi:hypothetical protein